MPRINRYKIINFKYGKGVDRLLDDTTVVADASHLCIEATNSVGKSMSIQTIIQAICPLADVDKEAVTIYNFHEPVYSMIEWVLDDVSQMKLLIGIGFKRRNYVAKSAGSEGSSIDIGKLSKADIFDYFTFIIECRNNIPIDISSLEFKQKIEEGCYKIKSLDEARDEIITKGAKHKGQVFTFAKSNGIQYRKKLAEYGIFQKEWLDIIIKLNKKEGALGEFFKNSASNEKLFRDKLFPLIEETLVSAEIGKDSCFIFAEQVFHFAEEYQKNIDKIKEVEELTKLQEFITELKKAVLEIIENREKKLVVKNELNRLAGCCEKRKKVLVSLNEKTTKEIEQLEKEEKHICFVVESRDYRTLEEKLNNPLSEIEKLNSDIKALENDRSAADRKLKIIEGNSLESKIKESNGSIAKTKASLEKSTSEAEEIEKKRKNIGFSLSQILSSEKDAVTKTINENKASIAEFQKEISQIDAELPVLRVNLEKINTEITKHEQNNDSYNKEVNKFMEDDKSFSQFINNQTLLDKLDFSQFIKGKHCDKQNNQNRINELNNKLIDIDNKTKQSNENFYKFKVDYASNSDELNKIEAEISKYNEFSSEINNLADSENLQTTELWDRQGRDSFFQNKLSKLQNDKIKWIIDKNKIIASRESIKLMQNPSITSELMEELDNLGITNLKQGFEYLCKANFTEGKRNDLLKNNPLLPYSLMMSRKSLDRLKNIEIKTKTDSVIPIIANEDLENILSTNSTSSIINYHDINLISGFDTDIIGKEKRESSILKMDEALNKIDDNISNLHDRYKRTDSKYHELKNIPFEEKDIYELERKNLAKTEEQRKIIINIKQCEDNKKSLHMIEIETKDQIKTIEGVISSIDSSIKTAGRLNELYNSILNNQEAYKDYKEQKESKKAELDSLDKRKNDINKSVVDKSLALGSLKIGLEHLSNKVKKYYSYTQGETINGAIEELEAQFEEFSTSSAAASVDKLREDLRKETITLDENESRLKEILAELGAESIPQELIIESKEYISTSIKDIKQQIYDNRLKLSDLNGQYNIQKGKLIAKEESIGEKYGEGPLSQYQLENMGLIRNIEKVKEDLSGKNKLQIDTEGEISKLKMYIDDALSEYTSDADFDIIEDLSFKEIEQKKKGFEWNKREIEDEFKVLEKAYTDSLYRIKDFTDAARGEYNHILIFLNDNKDKYEAQKYSIENIDLYLSESLKKTIYLQENMHRMEKQVVNVGREYIKSVIGELKKFNAIGRMKDQKIFGITLPKEDQIKYYIVDELVENIKNENDLTLSVVKSRLTTYNLLNKAISVDTLPVKILKLELNDRKELLDWNLIISETTGAQQFCISFIMLVIMLEYKRYNEVAMDYKKSGKVLLMDNPFESISEWDFLSTLVDISKTLNVQIIGYTHITNDSIRKMFNRIYKLSLVPTTAKKEFAKLSELRNINSEEKANLSMYSIGEIRSQTDFFPPV